MPVPPSEAIQHLHGSTHLHPVLAFIGQCVNTVDDSHRMTSPAHIDALSSESEVLAPAEDSIKPLPQVYFVQESNNDLKVTSIPIAKESERAYVLETAFLAQHSLSPKRVLMKGVDIIAFDEKSALEHYAENQRKRLIELGSAMERARHFLSVAESLSRARP